MPATRSLLAAALLGIAALLAMLATATSPAGAVPPGAPGSERGRSAQAIPGEYVVAYRSSVSDPNAKTEKAEREKGFKSRFRYAHALKGFAARLTDRQVAELRADPDVLFVAPDRPVRAAGLTPLVAGDTVPSGIARVQAATATSVREASTANVAVIDSGVDLNHADLNVIDARNCVGGTSAQDDDGHGTHVAGTIAARNNGSGVVGMAPGTRTYAVKVLDSTGEGTFSSIVCGIDWVTATRSDTDPANDIAVANMSLGGSGDPVAPCETTTDPMHKAICASTAAGVTYVAAAGNSGWDFDYASAPDVPAAYPEVLTVTAMSDSDGRSGATGGAPACDTSQRDDRYATFSNFAATSAGAAHTIATPGACITSTRLGGGTTLMSGTSMAAPHMAGAVALCLGEAGAAGPCAGLRPAEIVQKMRGDAQNHNSASSGYGFTGDPLRPFTGAYFGYLWWGGTAAADVVAPVISSTSPVSGATGVATSGAVTVTFSEPMAADATQAAFTLVRASDGRSVTGAFSWSGNSMTFRPSTALAEGTTYAAKVGTGARDLAGNSLANETAWDFRTVTTYKSSPFAAVVEVGSLRTGSYSSLATDDNVYFEVNSTTSGARTTSWYGRVTGVSNDLRSLRVVYRGRSSASCTQTVAILRWTTNSWVQVDARTVSTTELLVDVAPAGAPADFVSGTSGPGEVRLRVRCTNRSASFYSRGDLMRAVYTAP